jgi:hypothetical protein
MLKISRYFWYEIDLIEIIAAYPLGLYVVKPIWTDGVLI